jgi:hypothetical protein
MVERHAPRFARAVSQKDLVRVLNEATNPDEPRKIHQMNARIEVVGGPGNPKKISETSEELSGA